MDGALRVIFGLLAMYGAIRRQREMDAEQLRRGYRRNKAKTVWLTIGLLAVVGVAMAILFPAIDSDWGRRNPGLLIGLFLAGMLAATVGLVLLLKRWPDYRPISEDRRT